MRNLLHVMETQYIFSYQLLLDFVIRSLDLCTLYFLNSKKWHHRKKSRQHYYLRIFYFYNIAINLYIVYLFLMKIIAEIIFNIWMDNMYEIILFPEEQLISVVKDLFNAGVETTNNTIGFIITYLITSQDVQRKVHEEIDMVLGKELLPRAIYKNRYKLENIAHH